MSPSLSVRMFERGCYFASPNYWWHKCISLDTEEGGAHIMHPVMANSTGKSEVRKVYLCVVNPIVCSAHREIMAACGQYKNCFMCQVSMDVELFDGFSADMFSGFPKSFF